MNPMMTNRRQFLKTVAAAGLGAAASSCALPGRKSPLPTPTASKLPPWRGVNLLDKFGTQNAPFNERDFQWMQQLGLNFARLPMSYRAWIQDGDWTKFRESTLKDIDHAVELGERYNVHICINFHRAPGYCVGKPAEPRSVWGDDDALRVCALHWAHFADRYKGVPNRQLSFNLFNEPPRLEPQTYHRVVSHMCDAIRQHDSSRLIICDGREWGQTAPTELVGLGVATATRGYLPFQISHFRADWMEGSNTWPTPTWPLDFKGFHWDKEALRKRNIIPWKELQAKGVGVMVGEFGAYNKTPHPVVIAWMRDNIDLWSEAGWGWAMWNLTDGFGIIDSHRRDVVYEPWNGHKLDRQMLSLLTRRA
jgi:endoglucanase